MDTFDNSKYEKYKEEAKERWGNTAAYAEYSEKVKNRSADSFDSINAGMDRLMGEFALCMGQGSRPDSPEAQALVGKLQKYITEKYYTCTDEILAGLGQMYAADERFKNNIDRRAAGTAGFISDAIDIYCGK
ncbi:MAG: TipAS antibiotic-recognition domain-containing protein [Clostridiales bacterium]|nr:TipAS antibiotic-recognition domain-containing protein [Clostridiales bacterium]